MTNPNMTKGGKKDWEERELEKIEKRKRSRKAYALRNIAKYSPDFRGVKNNQRHE